MVVSNGDCAITNPTLNLSCPDDLVRLDYVCEFCDLILINAIFNTIDLSG